MTDDLIQSTDSPADFEIAYVAKAKHADLYRAAKKVGGQSALAREIGVSPTDIGRWINLRAMPRFENYVDCRGHRVSAQFADPAKKASIEKKLYELTGKTLDELFPPEICNNQGFLSQAKTKEFYATVDLKQLALAAPERFMLPSPAEVAEDRERIDLLHDAMSSLSERERNIVKLRYGLGDCPEMTLDEVGRVMRITRERVRQIEAKAVRKMQMHSVRNPAFREDALYP